MWLEGEIEEEEREVRISDRGRWPVQLICQLSVEVIQSHGIPFCVKERGDIARGTHE